MSSAPDFRYARREDTPLILQFIRELADYEKMLDEVVADEATLGSGFSTSRRRRCIFAMAEGTEVGFALFFHNFSTFLGRAGLYLEDLYRPAGVPGAGVRQGHPETAGADRPGAGLRAAGVVVPGLEPAQHRLLSLPGRRSPCPTGPCTASPATPSPPWQKTEKRAQAPEPMAPGPAFLL